MTNFYSNTTANEEVATDELFVLGLEGKDVVSDFGESDCSAALEEHSVDPANCEFAIRVSTFIEQALKGRDCGVWLDPEWYGSYEEFISACKEVHGAEAEPQFQYVEFKGVPPRFITRDVLRCELWGHISEWGSLDDEQRVLVELYREHWCATTLVEVIEERFLGRFASMQELGWHLLESFGELDEVTERLHRYLDCESYANDARLTGDISWVEHHGQLWVFSEH